MTSGFIDSDGSIYYNESSGQVFIGISQKNNYFSKYPMRTEKM